MLKFLREFLPDPEDAVIHNLILRKGMGNVVYPDGPLNLKSNGDAERHRIVAAQIEVGG